ncbi:AraC family transcriptional regulator [Streptomonospora sediminis]
MVGEHESDLLSQVLASAGARCHVTGRLEASGAWSIRFPAPGRLKIITVLRGTCTFSSGLLGSDIDVRAGEAIAVNGDTPFVVRTDPALTPIDASAMTVPLHRIGAGAEFSGVGGELDVEHGGEALLTRALPPLLHITGASPQSQALHWLLQELHAEMGSGRAGRGFARDQIARLLFLQVLRRQLAQPEALPAGWLRLIADPRLAPAARAIHENPGHAWRLDELARVAAMSRTGFAARFRAVADAPPLAYLHDWRMRLAAHALVHRDVSVGDLALSIGYLSESAFITAFKRAFGTTPLRYRHSSARRCTA